MDNGNERSPLLEGRLAISTKLAYALGHIFNDLAAAMWFSYTLIYLQRVTLLKPVVAGALLLLGKRQTVRITHRDNLADRLSRLMPKQFSSKDKSSTRS